MGTGGARTGYRAAAPMLGIAALLGMVLTLLLASPPTHAGATPSASSGFQGVASCAGTTCHGRPPKRMAPWCGRTNSRLWQEPSTPGGAHSRAFTVLIAGARGTS